MDEFRHSIARLVIEGKHVGTAWLLSETLACTANHCVKNSSIGDEVTLEFPSSSIVGTVFEVNTNLDIAAIKLAERITELKPLAVIARPTNSPPVQDWILHGFPADLLGPDISDGGVSLNGTIGNFAASIQASPRIQLNCSQGGKVPKGQKSLFAGISGGPILICPSTDDESRFVLGVVSEHPQQTDSIIFCSPIDAFIETCKTASEQTTLVSWDAYRGLPFIVDDSDGTVRTNIDAQVLDRIWNGNLLGFTSNIRPDDSEWLTSAIERVIVHAPFSQTSNMTDLHFSGAIAWRSRCQAFSKEWLPINDLLPDQPILKYSFLENKSNRLPTGGRRFASKCDLAEFLQDLCNLWAMERLRDSLTLIFSDPKGYLKYSISPEIIVRMKAIWEEWKVALADAKLRHHFLGLMLTGNGGQSMEGTAAGVGPTTLSPCIVQTVAFTLAICSGLPTALQGPKAYAPGNLGDQDLDGHSCGVQTLGGSLLQMADRSHQWTTSFVMLPHLSEAWETFATKQTRLDKNVDWEGQSFQEQPYASVVISRDTELLTAIGRGIEPLQVLLAERCAELASQQETYVQGASDVKA